MVRRKAVRDAVLAAIGGIPATISASRVYPFGLDDLPALNVLTGAEDIADEEDALGASYPLQVRVLTVSIACTVAVESVSSIDDALDDLAYQIEQALSSPNLSGVVDIWRYDGADDVEYSDEFESPVAGRALNYLATYRVDVTDPT